MTDVHPRPRSLPSLRTLRSLSSPSSLRTLRSRIADRAASFEPRGSALAIARTLVACAQAITLLLTPDRVLFAADGTGPAAPNCSGTRTLTFWCLGPTAAAPMTARRLLALSVLVVAAAGFRPRWTCVPHWYVTFSLTATSAVADAGDGAARIVTALLIPMLLLDERRWHWTAPSAPLPPSWRGAAYAAWLLVRFQVVIVYTQAGLAKAADPFWRQGTALYYWLHGHYWGAPPAWRGWLFPALDRGWFVKPLTWSVMVLELGIAICVLGPPKARRLAIAAAVVLHGSIAAVMGLFSFGLAMIAMVVCADASTGTHGSGTRHRVSAGL